MASLRRWKLGPRLALLLAPFVLLALTSILLALWLSSVIDGGRSTLGEVVRMPAQVYALSLSLAVGAPQEVSARAAAVENTLASLRRSQQRSGLSTLWNEALRVRITAFEQDWLRWREGWAAGAGPTRTTLRADTDTLIATLQPVQIRMTARLARWTMLLTLLRLALLGLAAGAVGALFYALRRFVIGPIEILRGAIQRIQGGDFTVRVTGFNGDEFHSLSNGFNGMAGQMQSMYHHLEARVAEKTREIEDKRERLEALYGVTALVATATNLDDLARGFARRVSRAVRADGVALRWSDEANKRYLMLATEGLPTWMSGIERCIVANDCHCGAAEVPGVRVIPIRAAQSAPMLHCAAAGFETLVSVPIRHKTRLMGEIDLFFHAQLSLSEAERSLLEVLTAHLAGAMENLRLNALEKEALVSQERTLLASEMHDSIAQSLAFLKIQVQLMRDALDDAQPQRIHEVLNDIEIGVRECYGDVRELLMHYRTRTNAEDIEPALHTTLRKFEHQSGLKAALRMEGHGIALAPDRQLQVLHIVQEALSNVRKHAQASQVWVDVQQYPRWRFEVRDNGIGFEDNPAARDEIRVGLRIMAERAERIGASLHVRSTPQHGTSVILTLSVAGADAPENVGRSLQPVALH